MPRSRRRAPQPGRASAEEASEAGPELFFHLTQRPFQDLSFGNQHEVEGIGPGRRIQSEGLPEQALRAVALHRPPELSGSGQAEPVMAALVHRRDESEEGAVQPLPPAEDVSKLGPGEDSLAGAEAAATADGHPLRPRSACAPFDGAA